MSQRDDLRALSDAASGFTIERWIESLHEDVHGSVWTTKAELRAVLSGETRTGGETVNGSRLRLDGLGRVIGIET